MSVLFWGHQTRGIIIRNYVNLLTYCCIAIVISCATCSNKSWLVFFSFFFFIKLKLLLIIIISKKAARRGSERFKKKKKPFYSIVCHRVFQIYLTRACFLGGVEEFDCQSVNWSFHSKFMWKVEDVNKARLPPYEKYYR